MIKTLTKGLLAVQRDEAAAEQRQSRDAFMEIRKHLVDRRFFSICT